MLQIEYIDLLGMPFARGGRGPDSYDCYGLVRELFARMGKPLPDFESPGSLEEIESLMESEQKKWIKVPAGTPGSLVRFRSDSYGAHVGFVLGADQFIHTVESTGVVIERLSDECRTPLGYYDYA